ncbi:MAG: hypothetical protein ABJ000_01780 [Saccharospirillum sp.]|uniref:substrate-binding periplasmic protein n=1 Tax=Saccharospirillum sp. TaxID=2033801 RepID=UPI003297915F
MKRSPVPSSNKAPKGPVLRRINRCRKALVWPCVALCLGLTGFQAMAQDWVMGFAEDEAPVSDGGPDEARGIIPELTAELFDSLPGQSVTMTAGPWVRIQRSVETGQIDGFVTYPSSERKTYALFSNTPLFHMDFGFLIYRRDHPQRQRIEQARSFEDLQGLTFIGQQGAEWERDNIPATLDTVLLGHTETMMHMLVRRQTGDFMVMPAEQAVHIAKQLGYEHQIAIEPVRFIPNASIPFHVGIRSDHPEAHEMLTRMDNVLRSGDYRQVAEQLLTEYREAQTD